MTIPEDMSELVDVNIDRVDLVGKAANGHRFLLAKSTADAPSLISPDLVRELIKESEDGTPGIDLGAALSAVAKAGRALSSANEAALRNAAEAIQKVLASLPAPEEAPIEKETPVAENPAAEPIETDVIKDAAPAADAPEPTQVEDVEKAGALCAVYDASGKLVGVVKPNAITPVDGGGTSDKESDVEEVEASAEADDSAGDEVQPEDGAPAETLADDEALIPGTETVQSPVEKTAETEPEPVTQAPDVAAMLKEAVAEAIAPFAKKIEDLADENNVLKGQVEALGREPDDRNSPLLNGATGEGGIAKRAADTDELADLRKSVEDAAASGDPAKIANAQQAYAFASVRNRFANL